MNSREEQINEELVVYSIVKSLKKSLNSITEITIDNKILALQEELTSIQQDRGNTPVCS